MKFINNSILFLFCLVLSHNVFAQSNDITKNFYFGKKLCETSGTIIDKPILYNNALGYGFDYQSVENVVFNKKSIAGDTSVYFSVKLPEGNYKIEVVIGGKKSSNTSIKAESRRLMLKEIKLKKNETSKHVFTVNVRSPKINEQASIKVKDRDKNQLNWDDKLTLEFLGAPSIKSLKISSVTDVKTVFLAGDSTVTDQDVEPWASWGQFITNYFSEDVVIANYAESGSSLSGFKGVKRLEKIVSLMKTGDYLFIEFAHNDEKQRGEGIGPWQSYSKLLKEYITEARNKGGIPVLVTPTQRRAFNKNGTLKPTHGDFPDAMRKVAKEMQVPLIDVTKMTTYMYESWGVEPSRKAFVQYPALTFPRQIKALEDNTHFNSFGANEIAKSVVQGIKDLNLELAKYLKPNIPDYNPKKPDNISDWTVPMSSRFEIKKPDGN